VASSAVWVPVDDEISRKSDAMILQKGRRISEQKKAGARLGIGFQLFAEKDPRKCSSDRC
jgi:hypothetical protein